MLQKILLFSVSLLVVPSALSDDALVNPVAFQIKKKVTKHLDKKAPDLDGFCDLMIEMRHSKSHARVHKVTTSGDSKICKISKKVVIKGDKYRFSTIEKYIRIHISHN